MLYEMVTGTKPYPGTLSMDTLKVIKKGNLDDDFYRSLGLVHRQNAVYYDREGLDSFEDEE